MKFNSTYELRHARHSNYAVGTLYDQEKDRTMGSQYVIDTGFPTFSYSFKYF